MKKPSKPTSLDIAYLAGVSQSTVSRALSGSPLVSVQTRARVEAAAKSLNYKVDQSASRLRAKSTKTIALLLCEDPGWGDTQINPFFVAILSSIASAATQYGYDLLLSFQQSSIDWAADFESAHRADGIILLGYGDHVHYCEKLERLNASQAHFVSWGAEVEGQPSGCFVGCNNITGGAAITRHLLLNKRQRIAFIGDNSVHSPEFLQRYEGYMLALKEYNLAVNPALQVATDASSEKAGYIAAKTLMARNIRFDAIFGASDLIALGAMQALNEADKKVPQEVAVVGFDDIPIAGLAQPPLTTMRQDTHRAGEILVENLLQIIAGESPPSVLLPSELIVRKSCGANLL